MIHYLIAAGLGGAMVALYQKHKTRGVDECSICNQFEQIGPRLKYIEGPGGVETPFCIKCKPEIFNNRLNLGLFK
jgi:hypothetical protein